MFSRQLEGRVAFITGAANGIGRGIAEVLANRGAKIAVSDIDFEAAQRVAAEIVSDGGTAVGGFADVSEPETLREFASQVENDLGKIEICVANAGVIGAGEFGSRVDHSKDDWRATWNTNLLGTVNTVEVVKPRMLAAESGKIIIVSSQGGRPPRGIGGMWKGTVQHPYLVSKAALIQYTHHLAIELGPFNINVNAVCPGTLWTPMWEQIAANHALVNPEFSELAPREFFDCTVSSGIPLQRAPTPNAVGKTVAFLASDDASEITGQALNVNGGAVMN